MSEVKVMGHVPPDTDATCSPIVYAWYLSNYKKTEAKAYVSGNLNKEAQFVLNHFNVEVPQSIESVNEEDKLVLVDTNNPEELVAGWDKAEIIEIVDHHKLAGITTPSPVTVTMRPFACTATVIWDVMSEQARNELLKEMAGLMLACIISDTLKFTSPTTTDYDKQVAQNLAEICEENIDDLATQMFAAKSDLTGLTTRDILLTDHKDFDFGGKKYKVAVLETTDPNQALNQLSSLKEEMLKIQSENNLAGIFFFVVDILNSEAKLIVNSEEEKLAAEKAFGKAWEGDYLLLPGVVSRKKQMVPNLEKVLS